MEGKDYMLILCGQLELSLDAHPITYYASDMLLIPLILTYLNCKMERILFTW